MRYDDAVSTVLGDLYVGYTHPTGECHAAKVRDYARRAARRESAA
jgi:hypothetical protein